MVKLLALLAAVVLFASLILHLRFTRDNQRGEQSLAWPVTPGRITQSRLDVRQHRIQATEYIDNIEYEYTVAGRVYRARSVDLRIRNVNNLAAMREFVDSYRIGQPVPVHYDPANPEDALLVPGPVPKTAAPRLLASRILLSAGACLGFFAWWTGRGRQ
jgi:uncharacterized protein DUF3592